MRQQETKLSPQNSASMSMAVSLLHFFGHGKLTEGQTDFAWKGGTLH